MIPRTKALEAKALIESWQPDGVVTADDKAAKYIIKPFYKEHTMPFVFCGINWTVQEYGFPHRNVTGMIEMAPIDLLFDKAETYVRLSHNAFCMGANTLTEHKKSQTLSTQPNMDYRLVSTTEAWLTTYETLLILSGVSPSSGADRTESEVGYLG